MFYVGDCIDVSVFNNALQANHSPFLVGEWACDSETSKLDWPHLGSKQQGEEAVKACNVFYYCTYEDKVDLWRCDQDQRVVL